MSHPASGLSLVPSSYPTYDPVKKVMHLAARYIKINFKLKPSLVIIFIFLLFQSLYGQHSYTSDPEMLNAFCVESQC